jgi:S-adenosyl-L-methionine hydrolase (adenosine-forming)
VPPARPIITLLTDFGTHDYFVASMKGVILSIHPETRVVDLSHQIAPQQIEEAGYVLHSCYRYFPEGTVHVAVVDPGVGSSRRALLVSANRHYFLAPDNGLLSRVFLDGGPREVRSIEQSEYRLAAQGATFDGRDLFAPAAAWLVKGTPVSSFGPVVDAPVLLPVVEPHIQGKQLIGRIEYVDRFGNLISNLTPQHLQNFQSTVQSGANTLRIGGHTLKGLVASYSDGLSDTPAVLVNSSGRVEVFVNGKSAARHLHVGVGADIVFG